MAHRHRRFSGLGQEQALVPASSEAQPLWAGVPIGVGVTYAATKLMPRFNIQSDWLFPVPYTLPALALGLLMLRSRKWRKTGYGTLGGALGYYLYAAVYNVGQTETARAMTRRR